mgnify:CR=1 FL=1
MKNKSTIKQKETMTKYHTLKTKKSKFINTYDVSINNSLYEVEKVNLGYGTEWTIKVLTVNGVENTDHDKWIDTVDTLRTAKNRILNIEADQTIKEAEQQIAKETI